MSTDIPSINAKRHAPLKVTRPPNVAVLDLRTNDIAAKKTTKTHLITSNKYRQKYDNQISLCPYISLVGKRENRKESLLDI